MSRPFLKAPLALTLGDPAGCGPLITAAAWKARREHDLPAFFVIGPPGLYAQHGPVQEIDHPSEAAASFQTALPVYPSTMLSMPVIAGQPEPAHAPAIISSIEQGVDFCRSGEASGLVTNPIHKALLYEAGFAHPGHTEFLAALCSSPDEDPPRPVMMLVGGGLRVALATIHCPLMDVAKILTANMLCEIGVIVRDALETDFGIDQPRLAFTGLNPHAGEDGTIGKEEVTLINPAAKTLRQRAIDIADARPADTVFAEALDGRFDGIIAMTHDQGLIPVKTLDFWGGVNVTLGLPIIRTSPDHGTAYEAAAARTARADSLIAAIQRAGEMAQTRQTRSTTVSARALL